MVKCMIRQFFYFFCSAVFFPATLMAKELPSSASHQVFSLHGKSGEKANLGLPVSIARLDSKHLAIASYLNIWILNETSGFVQELKKPDGVSAWYPTGLAYDPVTHELFVANYLGKDILILERNSQEFFLKHQVQDTELAGAENIALSRDGKYFAVADFDNNGVLLFDRRTNKKIWYAELGRAHGVDFDSSDKRIIAAGLAPPQVAAFDLKGNRLLARGDDGWDANSYLWPTGVATDPVSGKTWVTDAHLGRIRSLKADLAEEQLLGSNGLGIGRFNMPYGILYEPDGRLWVTDTFKSRVLLLDKNKRIVSSYISTPESLPGLLSCASGECLSKSTPFPAGVTKPLGDGYVKRVNTAEPITYDFGIRGLSAWNTGFNYNAFSNPDAGQLAMAGASPLFSGSIYYWVQAAISGEHLVFGSPQVREWVVDYQGLGCPVALGLNYWMVDGVLRSDQYPDFDAKSLVEQCDGRMKRWQEAMSLGEEPFAAYSEHVLGKSKELSLSLLETVFQSEKGVVYYKNLCRARTASERKDLSLAFINDQSTSTLAFLPELWVARIFSSSQTSAPGQLPCLSQS